MLTTKQIAEKLNVSVRRVQAYIHMGRLRAERIGRDWMVTEKNFSKFKILPIGRPKQVKTRIVSSAEINTNPVRSLRASDYIFKTKTKKEGKK